MIVADGRIFEDSLDEIEKRALSRLARVPGDPQALAMLVSARRLAGDLAGAREVLESFAREHPDQASIPLELGQVARDLGDPEAALAAFVRAVNLDPKNAAALRLLAGELAKAGKGNEARDAFLKQLALSLSELEALETAAARHEGDRLLEYLHVHGTDVCIGVLLAELELRLNRLDDAESRLKHILELSPNFTLARYLLAVALHRQTNAKGALEQLERLLANDPGNVACLNLKALSLSHLGDYAQSLACYETLVRAAPGVASFRVGYGHVLKTLGRVEDAVAAYRKAVELQPTLGDAYWQLADLKTFRFTAADIQAMRRALAGGKMRKQDAAQMQFALGKALEDAQEYGRSFEAYAEGNAIRRRTVTYSADENSAFTRRAKTLFQPSFFAARHAQGAPSREPIFIVGLTRSGSTLVEQILASHPAVEGTAELPAINVLVAELQRKHPDGEYPNLLSLLDGAELASLGEAYLERTRIHRKLDRPYFIDKMPGNFLHLGLIHLILPNARIIDARRHPLACGFANFKQHFTHGQPWSYDLTDIGRYYHDYVELMAHFDTVLPGRVHRVIYESLVADPERETRALLDSCGLEFDPACLRFYENRRPVLTASAVQVRRPIFRDTLEQWRHFELWLDPLKDALGDVLSRYPDVPIFLERSSATTT